MTYASAVLAQARSRKDETRQRIVDTASRLFQERGVDGVGVDEIMRESGLTHGGFYAHFENKEALVEEACIRAFDAKADELSQFISALDDDKAFDAFQKKIVSGDPHDAPTCPMAMLGPEVARREAVQKAYAQRMRRLIKQVAQDLDCEREHAMFVISALVGANVLAAQTSSDATLARQILNGVRDEILRCRD